MPANRVSQQAIAEMLSISRSTVTKVLNHDRVYRVAEETRKLILETAETMKYRARRRCLGNIAYVACSELPSAELEIFQAVCQEAARVQYRVFLVHRPMPSYREISLAVNPLSADGALVLDWDNPEVVSELAAVVPVVTVGGNRPAIPGIDHVRADARVQGQLLTERLIECGHTDMGVIIHSMKDPSSLEALEGCKLALARAGVDYDQSMVWEKVGRRYPELISQMLNSSRKPTAILAWTVSDHAVILSTLQALGYLVPENMSYVGWAAGHFSNLAAFPEVTRFSDYFSSIARASVRRLLDRIQERNMKAQDIVVESALNKGETCIQVEGAPGRTRPISNRSLSAR